MQLSAWCVKSVTASLRLTHGEGVVVVGGRRRLHPGEGERTVVIRDRQGLLSGRSMSVEPSAGEGDRGRVRKWGGQLLSPLMSTHFFHQLSIYRPQPPPQSHPSIHTHLKGTEPDALPADDSQKEICNEFNYIF